MLAVNTRDFDLTPVLAELAKAWPEDWTLAARTRGAFHGVGVLDEVVVRVTVGREHRRRAEAEARNHLEFGKLGLPMRTPRPVRELYDGGDWTAAAYERIPGKPVDDDESWRVTREIYLPVLEALRSVEPTELLRPLREWCGGAHWAERIREVAARLDPEVRVVAERLLERIAETEADVAPSVIHGDLTPYNMLLDGTDIGLIDADFAAVGDPAINLTWIVTEFPHDELRRDLPEDELHRGRLNRAIGSLQMAAAARAIGNVPLEDHTLGLFTGRVGAAERMLDGS